MGKFDDLAFMIESLAIHYFCLPVSLLLTPRLQAVVRLASVGTNVSRLCTRIHPGYAAILYGDVETMASEYCVVTTNTQ